MAQVHGGYINTYILYTPSSSVSILIFNVLIIPDNSSLNAGRDPVMDSSVLYLSKNASTAFWCGLTPSWRQISLKRAVLNFQCRDEILGIVYHTMIIIRRVMNINRMIIASAHNSWSLLYLGKKNGVIPAVLLWLSPCIVSNSESVWFYGNLFTGILPEPADHIQNSYEKRGSGHNERVRNHVSFKWIRQCIHDHCRDVCYPG